MDELISTINKSCLISTGNDASVRRKTQFKFRSIEHSQESLRDKRRAQLLEDYKRKRETLLDEKRGLIEDKFDENEDWMDWQEGKRRGTRRWMKQTCKDQLMLSEWLTDRPHDLETDWTCVLCPEGQRTLVIAKRDCTRAYHKNGFLLAKFKSILPNGSPDSEHKNSDIIILDCIWKAKTKQLFALDVLHWKKQPLLNCDAQFRLYWLKSKLAEVRQLSPEEAERGVYNVFLPTHCSLSTLVSSLSEQDPNEVDGVLFYHNKAPYVSGQTPLVGWLKPFMLEERLGLAVPQQYLDLRPPSYTDLDQWVATFTHKHKRNPRRKPNQGSTGSTLGSDDSQNMDTEAHSSELVDELQDVVD